MNNNYWSNVYIDADNLLSFDFNKENFKPEQVKNTIEIMKRYAPYEAKTLQLIGFTLNELPTQNPLTYTDRVLTPSYRIIYNLNKLKFYTDGAFNKDSNVKSIVIEITDYILTYANLKKALQEKGIDITYDCSDDEAILKVLDCNEIDTLTLHLALVNSTESDDYIKMLSQSAGIECIYPGLLKKLDIKILYEPNKYILKFNLPVYNWQGLVTFFELQLKDLASLIDFE